MDRQLLRSALIVSGFVFLIIAAFIILEFPPTRPAAAQSAGCVNPLTGAQCTDTPGPTCGLPGLPACATPVRVKPTAVVVRVRPTLTPTVTPTPTNTGTSTATITPIPTNTPYPTPTPKRFPPLLDSIPNLIGLFHPSANNVAQLPSWMLPDNLKITDVEITQAIQCLHNPSCPDNSVALYSGKATALRVYVRLTEGPDSVVYPISGALCYGNTGAGGCPSPILPVNPIFVYNVADPVSFGRQVGSTTLNFILPTSYVTSFTTQTLTVYVNYKFKDLPSESYYKDNYKTIQYQVQASEPIYVRFYPVQDAGFFPPAGEFSKITDYLSRTYPTGEVYPSLGFPLFGKNYAWTTPDSWGCPKGWHDLINDLWYLGGGSGPIAYGEVPNQSITGGVIGCGVLGGPEAAGIAGASTDGRVAAQEIGHTMNLPHVPGCGAGGADLSYPEPNGLLDEFGTDPYNFNIYTPYSSYDFMGYCGGGSNSWTSIYTYNEIGGLLPRGTFNISNPHQPVTVSLANKAARILVGSGNLSPTSASLTQGFYVLDLGVFKTLTPDQGPYSIELQNVGGTVLYSQHFDLAQMSNDNPQTVGGFRLVLPWTDGTRKVVFKYQDKVIGHTTASAHAPALKLTAPMGGESWAPTGKQTITWTASDADRNPLSYMLQYSADAGQTWMMLAANLTDPTFTFDGDFLPGSSHGVIRVIATDGFNTTQVDSNQISVAPKAPLVTISSPADASTFNFGAPVILQAIGTDLLDGPLSGNQFSWSSNRDGSLGQGSPLILSNLSAGDHTITLSAQNSSGLSASASVHITILLLTAPTSTTNSVLLNALWLPVAFIVLLLAVIVLVILLVRRKAR